MYRILLGAIYAIGFVFLGLTFLIVLNKAFRETRSRWRRVRRWALEPKVLHFVHGDEPSILPALGGGVGRADREVLEDIFLSQIQRVRGIERERLRRALEELGYVDSYLTQLESARWWSRARAAEKLGLAGAVRATSKLAAALDDESPEVRIRAAKALGAVGGVAAIRPLIQALSEPSRWSSIRVADILADMGPQVVDEIVAHFPGLPLHAKVATLDILGRVRSPHTAPWLRDKVTYPEPDVRARACHALGTLADIEAGAQLRRALRDPIWPVRAMAAKALGKIRHFEAIPDLCETVRDREWWVRSNSARALREMGDGGIDALIFLLDDQDNFARHQAVLQLEEAGVLDQKVTLLARGEGAERSAAEAIVRRFIQAGQIGRLLELAATHRDGPVRQRLRKLLDEAPASGAA